MALVLVLLALVSPLTLSDPINIGSGIQNRWKKHYETFPGCGVMPGKDVDRTITGGVQVTQEEPFPWMVSIAIYDLIEIFSQKIAITIEQNLRVLQAKREFVLDSGFQESRKISPSQVLGCGYGLM